MKLVVMLIALAMLASCSSSNRPNPGSSEPATSREPWFCETGKENEQWECVQSETLAANPKPSRLPPKRAEIPSTLPLAVNPSTSNTFRQPAAPVTPPAIDNNPVAAPPSAPPAPADSPSDSVTAKAQTDANVPKHVALAYRPEKAVSILDLPGNFWAVQLLALSSKEALEEFARQHNIRGMSAARIANGDKFFYVLLLGIYESRAVAEEASEGLPAPFDNPWIRSITSLQQGMQAADALDGLSGTSAP